jgi:hypothetical protein
MQWTESLPPAIGNATVAFDGPTDQLLLKGDVDITEMDFADRIDWEDWVVEVNDYLLVGAAPESESYFEMDIGVRADRTIRLRNNLANATASANLRVIGSTARAGLTGTVQVQDGVAFIQDREFRVERGEMRFNDPWSWDPELDFDLVTDIQSRRREYRVNYLVFGPYSDWHTATRSDPPLPQADVNALLWYGITAEDLQNMGQLDEALAASAVDMLLADPQLRQQLGGFSDQFAFDLFDRVDLATGVNVRGEYSSDPRLVVEKRDLPIGNVVVGDAILEWNLVDRDSIFLRVDRRLDKGLSLSAWYASRQRDRVLPIGGAYGVDLRTRAEWDF